MSISAANSSLASRPADSDSTTDSISTAGHALGGIDGLTNGVLGLRQIDDTAGLHAARIGMAEADDLDGVAAAGQDLLRLLRPQPRDQADDLARSDVERGNERAAPRRNRLHLRRQAVTEGVHASPPFFFFSWP